MPDTYFICDKTVNNINDLTGSENGLDVNNYGEGTVLTDLPDWMDLEPSFELDSTSEEGSDHELKDNLN